jgi:hypothetical protein
VLNQTKPMNGGKGKERWKIKAMEGGMLRRGRAVIGI